MQKNPFTVPRSCPRTWQRECHTALSWCTTHGCDQTTILPPLSTTHRHTRYWTGLKTSLTVADFYPPQKTYTKRDHAYKAYSCLCTYQRCKSYKSVQRKEQPMLHCALDSTQSCNPFPPYFSLSGTAMWHVLLGSNLKSTYSCHYIRTYWLRYMYDNCMCLGCQWSVNKELCMESYWETRRSLSLFNHGIVSSICLNMALLLYNR